jgi:hypothetical protein
VQISNREHEIPYLPALSTEIAKIGFPPVYIKSSQKYLFCTTTKLIMSKPRYFEKISLGRINWSSSKIQKSHSNR